MVVRWVFDDPVTLASYTVPVNPNAGGTPQNSKNMNYINTAGPGGNTLAFEGRESVKEIQISGTILEQAHLNALQTWYDKKYQVTVTDDLLRVFTIYITDFSPTRARAVSHPWKHEYTLRYIILDWA